MMLKIAKLMRTHRLGVHAAATALVLSAGLATVIGQDEEDRNLPIEQTHSVNDAPATSVPVMPSWALMVCATAAPLTSAPS